MTDTPGKLNECVINNIISQIASLDLKNTKIEAIEDIIDPLFDGFQISAPIFETGLVIYRGRICEKPTHLSDIINPKAEFVRNYGRANDIGQSVFYAGIGMITPTSELHAQPGDTIVYSHWISTDKITLNHIGFSSEVEKILSGKRDLEKIYEFVEKTKNIGDLNTKVYNYLANQFIRIVSPNDNYLYKISAAISKKLSGGIIDGIMYPSVALNTNSDNIVLSPESVDGKFKLISIEFMKLISLNNNDYKMKTLDTATTISDSGEIEWSGRTLSWSSNNGILITVEPDEMVKEDSHGNRIFPTCSGDIIDSLTPLLEFFKKERSDRIRNSKQQPIKLVDQIYMSILSMVHIFTQNSKHFDCYIPFCLDPESMVEFLMDNLYLFEEIDDLYHVQLKNAEGVTWYDSKIARVMPNMEIFSEQILDKSRIENKYPNISFKFIYHTDII
jgi:hypothetical protein